MEPMEHPFFFLAKITCYISLAASLFLRSSDSWNICILLPGNHRLESALRKYEPLKHLRGREAAAGCAREDFSDWLLEGSGGRCRGRCHRRLILSIWFMYIFCRSWLWQKGNVYYAIIYCYLCMYTRVYMYACMYVSVRPASRRSKLRRYQWQYSASHQYRNLFED